mgnify:CR=1 FL=1
MIQRRLTARTVQTERLPGNGTSLAWEKTRATVNRLQTRIAKATLEERWNLVKRLQYLLTHSYSAKLLAVRTVTQNKGKRIPGVDGELWTTASDKMRAALRLTEKQYHAQPLRRVYIPKPGKTTKRPLSIPTLFDRAMQALYALALQPTAETLADPRSFGFRLYRSAQDASQYAFLCLAHPTSVQWILEGDIRGCFDNISHTWLMRNFPMDAQILAEFLKAGFVYEQQLFPTDRGTPQGGVVSPILANMALDGIETLLTTRYPKMKVHFIRYADGFIVTAPTKEVAKENPGTDSRIPPETRTRVVRGKDHDIPHRRWIRLSGLEHPEVQGYLAHKAIQRGGPKTDAKGERYRATGFRLDTGTTHRCVESGHCWMDELPPACCQQGAIPANGCYPVEHALAMGETETPKQGP